MSVRRPDPSNAERQCSPVAVVTGGGSGIGRAICRRLAADGAVVAVLDIAGDAARTVADEINADGHAAMPIEVDIASNRQLENAIDQVATRHGRIDVAVNNAGIRDIQGIPEITRESWDRTLAVNVTAAFFLIQTVLPHLELAGGGRIVNVASLAALRASPLRAAYTTSKAALEGVTRQAAAELASRGILVNAVAPGFIDTPLGHYPPSVVEAMNAQCPLGRRGTAEEVASVVAFLASSAASYVTGAVLPVDGGMSASLLIDAGDFEPR